MSFIIEDDEDDENISIEGNDSIDHIDQKRQNLTSSQERDIKNNIILVNVERNTSSTIEINNIYNRECYQILNSKNDCSHINLMIDDKHLRKIIDFFNKHPSKGIKYLCMHYNVDNNASPIVANILHTTPGLNNHSVRDFLVRTKNSSILRAFFDEMNLKTSLLEAIKTALGETNFLNCSISQIDHILRSFSFAYYQQNKSLYRVVYVYYATLSVILLNNEILRKTDITANRFDFIIRQVFPKKYLKTYSPFTVYRKIKNNPLPQNIFDPNEFNVHFKCEVSKKSNKWNSLFKKRFLSLSNNRIFFYDDDKMKNLRSVILLSKLLVKTERKQIKNIVLKPSEDSSLLNYMRIHAKNASNETNIKEITMKFKNVEERGLCSFVLKKALLVSFFQTEEPQLALSIFDYYE
ncbi:hypothetical protein TRFO_11431 [Tritrichomonas foetus]|uniref:SEC7 domain-containing protein n=1 Tax=Tritrichomonas foetus TaxID=1144522 RepID=A0A1J4J8E5_9EUKA|nr:hypothetical protein TRFO_11431 [Tritrichomonas foetus]|eukprot:OHS93963.1 hypothetical protein TRFO_11431 [Tritrichomonas foetus]